PSLLTTIGEGFKDAFLMAWEVWWALVLGFALSAIVQAWVPRERIQRALGGTGARPVALATGLGAASSSCSYAAIAIAKSLFQKGASAAATRPERKRAASRHRPSALRGRRAHDAAPATLERVRMVGRGAQLSQRLVDAVEGDHGRLPAGRVHRSAPQLLLQRPVRHPRS